MKPLLKPGNVHVEWDKKRRELLFIVDIDNETQMQLSMSPLASVQFAHNIIEAIPPKELDKVAGQAGIIRTSDNVQRH